MLVGLGKDGVLRKVYEKSDEVKRFEKLQKVELNDEQSVIFDAGYRFALENEEVVIRAEKIEEEK
jgi:hypothetical protein